MHQPPPAGPAAPGHGPAPSPWSPSVRSAMYLPTDAPARPGPWHLPQVRAQALQALIEDVAGWPRNIHGLLVLLLGAAGGGTLVLATSTVAGGWLSWLLVATASVAFLAWAVWGIWLERSGWRAIAAAGRWHAAYVRGTGASGHVVTPSVTDVFTAAMIVRLVVALGLVAGSGWALVEALGESGARSAHPGAYGAVAAVLGIGGLAVLAAFAGLLVALRRRPSAQARARAQGQRGDHQGVQAPPEPAPGPPDPGPAGYAPQEPGPQSGAPPAPGPHASGWPAAAGHGGVPGPAHPAYAPPTHPAIQHQGRAGPGYDPPAHPGDPAMPVPPAPGPEASSSAPPPPDGPPQPSPPAHSPPGVPAEEGEDVEATRLAARLGPIPAESRTREPGSVAVVLPDGRHVPGEATSLIGRDPRARAGEEVDALLRVADQSVSKTHLCLRISANQVSVTDRASTNGTVLVGPDGTETELEPWQETAVWVGSTLKLGSTDIVVMLPEDVP